MRFLWFLVLLILSLIVFIFATGLAANITHNVNVKSMLSYIGIGSNNKPFFSDDSKSVMKLYFNNFINAATQCSNVDLKFSCKCGVVNPPVARGSQALFVEENDATEAYLLPVTVDLSSTALDSLPGEEVFAREKLPFRFSPAIKEYRSGVWSPLERKYSLFLDHSLIDTKSRNPLKYSKGIASFAERTGRIREWTKELWVLPHFSNTLKDIYTNPEALDYWERSPKHLIQLIHIVLKEGTPVVVAEETAAYSVNSFRKRDPFTDRMPSCQYYLDSRDDFLKFVSALQGAASGAGYTELKGLPNQVLLRLNNTMDASGTPVVVVQAMNFPEQAKLVGLGKTTENYTAKIEGQEVFLRAHPEKLIGEDCKEYTQTTPEKHRLFECADPDCSVCVYTGLVDSSGREKRSYFDIAHNNQIFSVEQGFLKEEGRRLAIVDDSAWDTANHFIILELVKE